MPKVGNYVNRDERTNFADYNKAWSAKRKDAIQKGQQLRQSFTVNVFSTNMQIYTRVPLSGAQGVYASTTAVMSRINVLA